MAAAHIAGLRVHVDGRLRQRCAWCGAILIDYDLAAMQVPDEAAGELATWWPGAQILVDGPAQYVIGQSGDQLHLPADPARNGAHDMTDSDLRPLEVQLYLDGRAVTDARVAAVDLGNPSTTYSITLPPLDNPSEYFRVNLEIGQEKGPGWRFVTVQLDHNGDCSRRIPGLFYADKWTVPSITTVAMPRWTPYTGRPAERERRLPDAVYAVALRVHA